MVTTLGFSLIPLIALGFIMYSHFNVSFNDKIIENLKTLAENRRSAIDLFFDERVSQLVTIAHTHSLTQLRNEVFLNNVFNIMQIRSKSYIDIGIVDQEGNHLAYIGPYPELKEVNFKNEDWFQATIAGGIYISDVFLGFRKFPHFIIAVRSQPGEKNWILRATINSDIIDHIIQKAQTGKKGDAFIINNRNLLQTIPRFSGEIFGHPKSPDFSNSADLQVKEIGLEGEISLFTATRIKATQWILVIKEDSREQIIPLLKTRSIAVSLLLAGSLVIVLGAFLTTRAMMNQFMRMEREKALNEDLMIQSGKMAALGKMATGIAHEINNPLAVIGEKAGWLKDLLSEEDLIRTANFKEYENGIRKIEQYVDRAKKVTHRLLSYARRMEPRQEQVDINKTINDTVDFLENESRYRNIDIQIDPYPELPKISSDSSQLQQLLLNILNNAIDDIGNAGEIQIRTGLLVKQKEIIIEIMDNGSGRPWEKHNESFDPFFSTVYSIIEKLQGRIRVASESGAGTTITITLPVKEMDLFGTYVAIK